MTKQNLLRLVGELKLEDNPLYNEDLLCLAAGHYLYDIEDGTLLVLYDDDNKLIEVIYTSSDGRHSSKIVEKDLEMRKRRVWKWR